MQKTYGDLSLVNKVNFMTHIIIVNSHMPVKTYTFSTLTLW